MRACMRMQMRVFVRVCLIRRPTPKTLNAVA